MDRADPFSRGFPIGRMDRAAEADAVRAGAGGVHGLREIVACDGDADVRRKGFVDRKIVLPCGVDPR